MFLAPAFGRADRAGSGTDTSAQAVRDARVAPAGGAVGSEPPSQSRRHETAAAANDLIRSFENATPGTMQLHDVAKAQLLKRQYKQAAENYAKVVGLKPTDARAHYEY